MVTNRKTAVISPLQAIRFKVDIKDQVEAAPRRRPPAAE
jgi:hypothetical protein